VRNYYLSEASRLVSGSKSGLEDTPLAFVMEDFSWSYYNDPDASREHNILENARILSLPPAESGVLALGSNPVTVGQIISLASLDDLVFTPAADWNGETSFTWEDFIPNYGYPSGPYTLTLTLRPANDPPSLTPLPDLSVDEDAASSLIDLATSFTDPDGNELVFSVENSNPALLGASLDGASLSLAFLANQNGAAIITVTATDPGGESVTDAFDVTVNPVNDAPSAADANITVVAGKSQTISLDYDDLETAQADLAVTFGSLNGTLDSSALPNLKYTAPSTAGDDIFIYTVTDRGDPDGCMADPCAASLSATATIHVTVTAAPSGSITGLVFDDANGNGAQDAGEGGLTGVTVQLKDANGSLIGEKVTADGAYSFTGLAGGSYSVHETVLPGAAATTPQQVDVTLAEEEAKMVNFGLRVSADMKVTISAAYNAKTKIITYSMVVTNDGPADALNAVLTDALPGTVTFDSATTSLGTCSGTKTVSCGFGTLASGSSATVTLKVTRNNIKSAVTNTVTVSSSTFDIDLADNTATATVQ